MIYLDTSVALARLLSETRQPPDTLWDAPLVSSRLLACEIWARLGSARLHRSHGEAARRLIGRVALVDLSPTVLDRIEGGFPVSVRALDAIHLATLLHLKEGNRPVELATYDERLAQAAESLGIPRVAGLT